VQTEFRKVIQEVLSNADSCCNSKILRDLKNLGTHMMKTILYRKTHSSSKEGNRQEASTIINELMNDEEIFKSLRIYS
jgi:hypothetical protein